MSRVLIALGCLLLGACTRSPVPITAAAASKPVDALVGHWQYAMEDDTESVVIKKGENGELIVAGETPEGALAL